MNSIAQTAKMVGGGILVAGACFILFPDLLTYFGSITKLLLMVLAAILSAAFVTRAFYKVKSRSTAQAATSKSQSPAQSASSQTSAQLANSQSSAESANSLSLQSSAPAPITASGADTISDT